MEAFWCQGLGVMCFGLPNSTIYFIFHLISTHIRPFLPFLRRSDALSFFLIPHNNTLLFIAACFGACKQTLCQKSSIHSSFRLRFSLLNLKIKINSCKIGQFGAQKDDFATRKFHHTRTTQECRSNSPN